MATPHVAGTAALMISRGITPPAVIETILRRTAKDLGATGKDTSFGYGLIQPRTALFGSGVIR
jgi:serine protease